MTDLWKATGNNPWPEEWLFEEDKIRNKQINDKRIKRNKRLQTLAREKQAK